MTEESGQKLRDALSELHTALEASETLDAADRAELASAVLEIREVLGDPENSATDESLLGRLSAAVERFEDRYPDLTKIIGRVAEQLSELGI